MFVRRPLLARNTYDSPPSPVPRPPSPSLPRATAVPAAVATALAALAALAAAALLLLLLLFLLLLLLLLLLRDVHRCRRYFVGDEEGSHTGAMHGHTKQVTCLQFYAECVYSGSVDKTIRVWDIKTRECKVRRSIRFLPRAVSRRAAKLCQVLQ